MDPTVAPFLRIPTNYPNPDTPQLNVELIHVPFKKDSCSILMRFTRSPDTHQNNEPCIFHFGGFYGAFGPSGFLLFHHTAQGLSKVTLGGNPAIRPESEPIRAIDGWPSNVRELAPEGNVQLMLSLPKRYMQEMQEGEKYELVWPGSEVALWDWGTEKEHIGTILPAKSPEIWIPPAQVTVEFGLEREPEASPPPVEESERIPGTPKLSVTLECEEKSIATEGTAHVKIIVRYEAEPGSRPITFHSHPLRAWGYQLYCRPVDEEDWASFEDDTSGFMIVDDPDVTVNVTQDENFVTLDPGQSWSEHHNLKGGGGSGMPFDLISGEVV